LRWLLQIKRTLVSRREKAQSMTLGGYNGFCASLSHAETVIQWGGAHVWKIGGKVFSIGGWNEGELLAVTFKCSPMSFDLLKNEPGMRPAPYLASRGMSWLQRTSDESMDDSALMDYVRESYRLASLNLSKAVQKRLELNQG
jgi:predicted DNA-binding protein (MmcQ/YjbR family)